MLCRPPGPSVKFGRMNIRPERAARNIYADKHLGLNGALHPRNIYADKHLGLNSMLHPRNIYADKHLGLNGMLQPRNIYAAKHLGLNGMLHPRNIYADKHLGLNGVLHPWNICTDKHIDLNEWRAPPMEHLHWYLWCQMPLPSTHDAPWSRNYSIPTVALWLRNTWCHFLPYRGLSACVSIWSVAVLSSR